MMYNELVLRFRLERPHIIICTEVEGHIEFLSSHLRQQLSGLSNGWGYE